MLKCNPFYSAYIKFSEIRAKTNMILELGEYRALNNNTTILKVGATVSTVGHECATLTAS
jgi:hypothetical protein